MRGTQELRAAIADWSARRYGAAAALDPEREVLPLNGSREGLFLAALPAAGRKTVAGTPAVLMCNPYYSAYIGGALAVDAEPVYLNATEATGHLPDLEAIAADTALLDRTVALYLCSPANPQGAVASKAYIARALALARAHDFMLFFDECYSEIYTREPPPGALEVAAASARALPQPRRLQLAVEALQPAGPALGLLRRRSRRSSKRSPRSATWSGRRCRGRRSMPRPRRGATRRTSSPTAPPTRPSSTCATRCWAGATATAGRPAASSFGLM